MTPASRPDIGPLGQLTRYLTANALLAVTAIVGGLVILALTAASAGIYDAVAEEDGVSGLDQPTLDHVIAMRTPLANQDFLVGAFEGRQMVGQAGFIRHAGRKVCHKGDIWGVYVTAAARSQGVAKAMLLRMLDRVRDYPGLEQVSLSVSVSQEAARRLYSVLGFEIYGYEQHALKVGETYVDEEHRVLWLQVPSAAERVG